MSHREQLEQVLDLLINEEQEKAEELLHQVMVEKARNIYESILEDDMKGDFADEIEADVDEIEADEEGEELEVDDQEDEDEVEVDSEEDVFDVEDTDKDEDLEDRVEDLEKLLADLTAMIDMEVSDDVDVDDESMEMDMEMDMDMDEDEDEELEELEEATKLQDQVKVAMNKEGQLAGTGKNSQVGPTGTEAPYTHAPKKETSQGKPTDFAGGDEKGTKAKQGKDHTPTSNVDVKQTKAPKAKEKEESSVSTDSLLAN